MLIFLMILFAYLVQNAILKLCLFHFGAIFVRRIFVRTRNGKAFKVIDFIGFAVGRNDLLVLESVFFSLTNYDDTAVTWLFS